MGFENPPYELLESDGHIELRQYDNYIVAEVTLTGSFEGVLSQGFRILADYIFGNNRRSEHIAMTVPVIEQPRPASEKIAMTAPVVTEDLGASTFKVAFMMPSKYTLETLPQALDERITFRIVPAHMAAATRFSGSMGAESAMKHRDELEHWVNTHGLSVISPFTYANYSPPWIPPFLRRNEVIVDVERVK